MIHALFGENTFASLQELKKIIAEFEGTPEIFDGETLSVKQLPDLFMAATLFASKRLIIIKNSSENSVLWNVLGDWLPRLSDDIDLVLVDTKPDKRTSTYKAIKSVARLQEFSLWTERDYAAASKWVQEEARRHGISLSMALARLLVERVGVDQWALYKSIEKLALLDNVTEENLIDSTDARPQDNVFILFETALKGDRNVLIKQIRSLQRHEDPHRVLALLASQAFQLAATHAAVEGDNPAKDFSIHPFVASKLKQQARRLDQPTMQKIISALADADNDMKQSRGEPWLVVERELLTIASL